MIHSSTFDRPYRSELYLMIIKQVFYFEIAACVEVSMKTEVIREKLLFFRDLFSNRLLLLSSVNDFFLVRSWTESLFKCSVHWMLA